MKIKWGKTAEKSYFSILDYITHEFGSNSAQTFKRKTIEFLALLEKFPDIGSMENPSKTIRGFLMTKATKVFYRIKKDNIILLKFFDVRQSPNKRPK